MDNEQEDIIDRLENEATFLDKTSSDAPNSPHRALAALCREAAGNIKFLRKQSRGHFDALTVVLRDGIEALTPDLSDLNPPGPKKAN